jgi:hypothetical protein
MLGIDACNGEWDKDRQILYYGIVGKILRSLLALAHAMLRMETCSGGGRD